MQQSSNPVFSDKRIRSLKDTLESTEHMTVAGSLVKTGLLLTVLVAFAAWSWVFTDNNPTQAGLLTLGASIAALIVALIIIFKKPSPLLVTLYAGLEGIVIGAISFLFGNEFQGIVLQAVTLTLSVTFGMLFLYSTGLVKVTQKLRSIILIATFGVLLFYIVSFIIGLFSASFTNAINSGSLGIVIAAVIVLIAALNLLLDFDFIDKGSQQKLPKQMEWYAAFGLMVTLIWLYISILRLLAASRR